MSKLRLLLAALLFAPVALQAAAPSAELRYDYIDIGVASGEVDNPGGDMDFYSFGAVGSWGLHENIALFGAISTGETETAADIDIETTGLSIGLNPHFSVTDKIDIVIPVALEFAEFESTFLSSEDDIGYSVGIGARFLPTPAWEFGIGAQHFEIFDEDDQIITGNIRWHLNELLSMSLGAAFGDDASQASLDLRLSF